MSFNQSRMSGYRDAAGHEKHVMSSEEKGHSKRPDQKHEQRNLISTSPPRHILTQLNPLAGDWKSLCSKATTFILFLLGILAVSRFLLPKVSIDLVDMKFSGLISSTVFGGLFSGTTPDRGIQESENSISWNITLADDETNSGSPFPKNDHSWHRYVRSPSSRTVKPMSIVPDSINGNVTNAKGMIGGHGKMTLSRVSINKKAVVPSVVLDFGQNVVGYLSISFAAASNNTPGMRLAFSETLQYLTDVSDFSRSDHQASNANKPGSDQIAVSPQPHIWTNQYGCQKDGKVCSDGLHGFRYVRISLDTLLADAPFTSPFGFISIDEISLQISGYMGTPKTFNGWFECSDAELNQYWYDGAYTNDMTTDIFGQNDTEIREAYSTTLDGKLVLHDGAKRDRDPYMGDLAIAARTAYVTHSENSLAAMNVMADLADHQRDDGWIPPASIVNYELGLFDYPLWWVACSYDYLMYTGNETYAEKHYPVLLRVLDNYYESYFDDATGLLLRREGSSEGGDYAFIPRSGFVTYYNALYVRALRNAASVADSYGTAQDAIRWRTRAKAVSAGVNKYLWDDRTGAYLDSLGRDTHSQDGNMLSILSGIATPSHTARILTYWSSLSLPWGNPFYSSGSISPSYSTRVYAFISYFELCARITHTSLTIRNSAIEQIHRMYGWMSQHDPYSTFWEGIGDNGEPYEEGFTSMAHGWSTGVTPLLTNYILGVEPIAFGFAEWSVRPRVVDGVEWARGEVDTPHGVVSVNWRKVMVGNTIGGGTGFEMNVGAPPGTRGRVCLPVKRNVVVLINERIAWKGEVGLMFDAEYVNGEGNSAEDKVGEGICFKIEGGMWTLSAS